MKPLKLTMCAFGSYAGEEILDFTELGFNSNGDVPNSGGLYLITGETGSGKTTIFDAISYALFGKASGSARNDYKMLRSDYAERNAKTYVELAFSSGGNIYTIRRDIIPHIARKTEEITYTDGVSLTLPDGTVIDRGSDVGAKILEVIGLDREQFAQIVMIAQNDFLRFLQSGTDDRVKILRRIFGTDSLKSFQESLKAKAREKDEERNAVLREFGKYEVDPYKRDERFAEWENQIKADEAAVKDADKTLTANEEASKSLAAQAAVAEGIAKAFASLVAQRKALGEHDAKRDEMNVAGERKDRGETALRKVRPFAEKADEAAKTLASASGDLETAKKAESDAELTLAASKKTLAGLPPADASQDAFDKLCALWEQNEAKLKKLAEIKRDYGGVAEKQTELAKEQSAFEMLTEQYKIAKTEHDGLYELFLRGQAGILSATLEHGTPCPVCGSVEHPAPAGAPDGDVSEGKLKKLAADADKSKGKLDGKANACASLKADISTLTSRFLEDFHEFSPDSGFETAGADLDALLLGTKARSEELTVKKNAGETALAKLKNDFDLATKQLAASELKLASAHTLAGERDNRAKEQKTIADAAKAAYQEALAENGFDDAGSYAASLVSEEDLAALTKMLADYEDSGKTLRREIARLESETADKAEPDLASLKAKATELKENTDRLRAGREETKSRLDNTARILKELRKSAASLVKTEKEYAALKGLSETANGKLDFETYAQMAYFERVLRSANLRLKVMSQKRYVLVRQEESGDGRKRTGLEIEVADSYTGRSRSANSLSGGESFMASLSLALGLSDVVQQTAGGVRLDAMFIDEGFGFLDAEVLELSVRTLSDMAGGSRIVGIISHVAELRERIDKQVRIEKTPSGSKISLVV
ncbi:MAG: SMC family ATPase [Clostridiales Family XIII bacterium]|jgi:exonuclease SbcC|nr:SMC family ATPase [Clostridiales Family XIII bacterium]